MRKDIRFERVGEFALGALASEVVLEGPEEVRAFEKRRRLEPVEKVRGILCVNFREGAKRDQDDQHRQTSNPHQRASPMD